MIQLTEKIAITSDDNQYIVGIINSRKCAADVRKDNKKERLINHPRYYTTLTGAVKNAVELAMREKVAKNEITTLGDYVTELKRIQDDFTKKMNLSELK